MITVEHKVRAYRDGPGGIVALRKIEAGETVWKVDPENDRVLDLEGLRNLTEIHFEALLVMGHFIRLPYSRLWVVGGDLFGCMKTSHSRLEPNLRAEFDSLVAARSIRKGQQLIAPADFDQDRDWKNRVFKSFGYLRSNNEIAAKPTLDGYIKYVERAG
jgi:hypothetical protein